MIYVVFSDRIGNNLFQFSAAISLNNEVTICVPDTKEYLRIFEFSETFFKGFNIINYVPGGIEIYEEPFYHYNEIPYVEGRDLIIKGYFQSFKYINRDIVIRQFSPTETISSLIRSKYSCIFYECYTSIHVRRGDYMTLLFKHPFCGLKYYREAIELIGSDEKFIILSDDIRWCKRYLKLKNVIYVENSSPIIDLYIQSFCSNNIISNSSFSWWGSYLNIKKNRVIAPKMWFGFDSINDTKDLLFPDCDVIENTYSIYHFSMAFFQWIRVKLFFYLNIKRK